MILSLSFDLREKPMRFFLWAFCVVHLFLAGEAYAHGVFIFVRVQDNSICTESYFSGNVKVQNGVVTMHDADGVVLATAVTDTRGRACFDFPQKKQPLTFVLNAGQGHRAEFLLESWPLPETSKEAQSAVTATGAAIPATTSDVSAPTAASVPAAAASVPQVPVESPVTPALEGVAEFAAKTTPGLSKIVGGIGIILCFALILRQVRK